MNDVCPGCGEPNPPGTQFCLFCGIYLGWDERDAEPEPGDSRNVRSATAAAAAPSPSTPAAPSTPATPTEPGAPAPTATVSAVQPVKTEPVDHACPDCGRDNGPERRFCGHCGRVLATGAPARRPAPRRRSWWQRLLRSDTRLGRRAYRRSLPPLYRWRRVGVTVLVTALVVTGFAVVGRDPLGWGVDRWHDVTNRLEPVRDTTARAEPEDSVVGDNDAAGLVDADPGSAWLTEWAPPEERPECGDGDGGQVVLTFPAARIRELHVLTGVRDPSERLLQHIPTQLDVLLPDGTCRKVDLDRTQDVQDVPFDTGAPVNRLTVSIGETFRSDDDRVQDVAGLSQLTLLARPTRGEP